MKFKVSKNEAFSGVLEFEVPGFLRPAKVLYNGAALERAKEKGAPYLLPAKGAAKSDQPDKLYIRSHFLDPVPAVYLNDKQILLAPNLRIIESTLAVLPIGMFIGRGMLPTLIGYAVILSNFRILRSKLSPTFKWAAIYALSLAAFSLTAWFGNLIWSGK